MATFGEIPSNDDVSFDAALSEDKRALTLTFSDLVATVDSSSPPSVTRDFSLVLPVEGSDGNTEIEFSISGAAVVTPGATATLMASISGQSSVRDFVSNPDDDSFVHTFIFGAMAPTECRLFVLLLAGPDSQGPRDGTALINVLSIDAEVLPREPSSQSEPV